MNVVTRATPVEEIVSLIQRDGYVLMQEALSAAQTQELSAAYDRQLD